MEYKEWFSTKSQTIQNNIKHDMHNEFGNSCSLTEGRPSSATYSSVISIGISRLKTEILLLLNESFDIFEKTEENIEMIYKEVNNIKDIGITCINSEKVNWVNLNNSKFAVNINPPKSKIDEIEMDIFREIEKQKQAQKAKKQTDKDKRKHDRNDIIWRAIPILISIFSALYSIFKK